jgi:hypothetical protein
MALVVGDNTYATVAEATAYFATRYGESAFSALTLEADKESALLMATVLLDAYGDWSGYPTISGQSLAFPRNGESTIPAQVTYALFEIADSLVVQGGATTEAASPLKTMKVDVIAFEWAVDSGSGYGMYYNRLAQIYLNPYCYGNGSSNTVTRV